METTQENNNGINGMERMLTVNDIATIMGYSTHTVREMVKSGVFKRVHRANLGNGRRGHIRIYQSDFEEWRDGTTDEQLEFEE
jgi:hypothetical protein